MKVLAMRNDPGRRHQELADIRSLMGLPGIQTQEIRAYFERYGLEEEFDDLEASL